MYFEALSKRLIIMLDIDLDSRLDLGLAYLVCLWLIPFSEPIDIVIDTVDFNLTVSHQPPCLYLKHGIRVALSSM